MNRINLEAAPINLAEFASNLPQTCAFKKDKLIKVQDFGTVFIGNISESDELISIPQSGTFIFTAPIEWKMFHLLKALNIFKSTTEARKNGWDMDIPIGCSSHLIKSNKILGEIWIHKEGI